MKLDGIKGEARSLRAYSSSLKEQFKDAIHYLTNIYNIVSRHDSTLARDVSKLIDRYYEMIRVLDNEYLFAIDDIERYVNITNKNIDDLTISFTKIANALDECISNSGK